MDRLLAAAPTSPPADPLAALRAAFQESQRRREQNSRDGGLVVAATHRLTHSWARTAEHLGEAETTLRRWARPYRSLPPQGGDR